MNKIIHLSLYIASLVMLPAYALDETDEQNMTGAAVKILNKYQGRWKGWPDGCVNCDKPLALELEKPTVAKQLVTKHTAKKKRKVKSKSMSKESNGSHLPMPKPLRRGDCGNKDSPNNETSKDTNCSDVNNAETTLKPENALGSESENKNNKDKAEETDNKKYYNMDVRDTPRPSDKNTKDKDNEDEKGESDKKESNENGATGNDGIDSSDDATNNDMNEKAEEVSKGKSKFSIFSIWDSK